jgi:hypothetical protein
MKISRPVSGKILSHDEGLGTPSANSVRQRAAELARIDGRSAPNEQDWKRAFLELHGGHHDPNLREDESDTLGAVSETDSVAPTLGRFIRESDNDSDGDENLGEELVTEGMDEAFHEQMLQSRKAEEKEEKEG